MATSLVAAIKTAFGIDAELIEGHDGIYEVSAAGQVVYSNSSACKTGFPEHREIIESIAGATGLTPTTEAQGLGGNSAQELACPFPRADEGAGVKKMNVLEAFNTVTDCGCGADASCCDADEEE